MLILWRNAIATTLREFGGEALVRRPTLSDYLAVFLFTAIMVIFFSKISWYDIRTIYSRIGDHLSIAGGLKYWAVALAPFLTLSALYVFRRSFFSAFPVVFILLCLHALITGVLLGNDLAVIVQEIFKYAYMVVAFMISERVLRTVRPFTAVKFMCDLVVFFVFARLAVFLWMAGTSITFVWGTPNEVLPMAVLTAFYLYGQTPVRSVLKQKWSFGALLLSLYGQKRTLALCAALAVAMAVLNTFTRLKLGRLFIIVLVLAGIGTSALLLLGPDSFKRYTNTDIEYETSGESRRATEIELVINKFRAEPAMLLVGYGGGATLILPTDIPVQGGDAEIHSIHNTVSAMILRHGILGLFIYLVTAFYGIFWCLRLRSTDTPETKILKTTMLIYKVLAFVASIFIYSVVDDMALAVMAAIIYKERRNEATNSNVRSHREDRRHDADLRPA